MPTSVLVLWWITLITAVAFVLPVAYYLLERTYRAARHVRDYTNEILDAAEGIDRNLAGSAELERLAEGSARIRAVVLDLGIDAGDLRSASRRG